MAKDQGAQIIDPFGSDMSGYGAPATTDMNLPAAGGHADQAMGQIITAQRVAVKRNIPEIVREIKAMAGAAGDKYYYDIPFKDRKTGKTTHVIGGSIKLATDLARAYGNCTAEVVLHNETPQHWNFIARFIDYEKGFTLTRPFQQRKGQDTGMKDGGRAADMVFQIGASKALRNVVLGALAVFVDDAVETAREGLVTRINKDIDGARKWLSGFLEKKEIGVYRVEYAYGKKLDKMTPRDIAKIYGELTSINDGFTSADDLYPEPGTDDADNGPRGEKAVESKPAQESKPEPEKPKAKATGGRKNPPKQAAAAPAQEHEPTPEPEPAPAHDPEPSGDGDDVPPPDDDGRQTGGGDDAFGDDSDLDFN